jgi:hypothetical protein
MAKCCAQSSMRRETLLTPGTLNMDGRRVYSARSPRLMIGFSLG